MLLEKVFLSALLKYKNIVFAEECYYIGGVGMLLQTELDGCGFKGNFYNISIKNRFIKHAAPKSVKEDCGLDSNSLRRFISEIRNIKMRLDVYLVKEKVL